jgi:hypothetical protein
MPTEQENAQVSNFRGKVAAGMPTDTPNARLAKRAFISRQGDGKYSNEQLLKEAYDQQNQNEASKVLSQSDLPKAKDGIGYQSSDGRTACEIADIACSWSVGAEVDPNISMREAQELDEANMVPHNNSYSASMYAGNGNVKNQLPSPANKRGPKTGANGPFDSATMDGNALNQSYKDDPPISQGGSMGQQVAGAPGYGPGRIL